MDALRAEGWFCYKNHGSEFMMNGLPDIICCAEGLFIGLETKHPESRDDTSVRQDYVQGLIREAGGKAQVVTSAKEAVRIVKQAIKEREQ
jgi:Holliday junction resolvase